MADNYALEVQEHVATFTKSMFRTVSEVEARAREEVARAEADALEARNERDAANKLLHATQLDALKWKEELDALKASIKQADMTIAHQKESIAQLRREATQWREQSKNWQDHFTRVEDERNALTAKLDGVLASRDSRSNQDFAPLTPVSRYADDERYRPTSDSPAPISYHMRDAGAIPSPPDGDHASTSYGATRTPRIGPPHPKTPATHPTFKSSRQAAKSHHVEHSQTAQPAIKVIRRVNTTIRVKREESDDEGFRDPPPLTPARRKSLGSASKRPVESLFSDDRSVSPADAEDVSGDDAENEDEEDDELRINAEHDGGVYKAIKNYRKSLTAPTPAKKRKLDASSNTSRTKSTATKRR